MAPTPARLPLKKGISLRWLPFFFIFLQSVLYGFGDPISKAAYEVLPVFSLLTVRYGIAFLFLLLIFNKRIVQGIKTASLKDWLLPSLCIGGSYVLSNIALELTALFSRILLDERLSLLGMVGAVIILLCVAAETLMKEDE